MIAGRYALAEELGRGGMGIVRRAHDTVIGRFVAVKELRLPDGTEDVGVFQERVLREVRTGGRLNEPAVVTVFDVVTEADTTFIVMELVEAPTLADLVAGRGPLPQEQVASVGAQVLSALRAAHSEGIVHRDVKPGNIMVAADGRVKLTDFGIAQAVDDPRLTTSGMLVGSPAFMAPERVAGHEARPASDLWALGATLYHAVEGTVPFERPTTAATLHAIMNEVPYLTRAHGPLASAIMGLLNAAPEGRISADQAAELLTAHTRHSAVSPATPPGGAVASRYGGMPTQPVGSGPPTAADPAPASNSGMTGPVRGAAAGGPRRTAAVVGGAVAAVALLAGGFFVGRPVWSPPTDDARLPTLTYGENGDLAEVNVDWRDRCVNTRIEPGRVLAESNWVDCDEPHDAELFERSRPVGDPDEHDAEPVRHPGPERLRRFGEAACELTFHSNRVDDELRDALSYRTVVPTRAEWETTPESSSDDAVRDVLCFVQDAEGGQLTGQARRVVR